LPTTIDLVFGPGETSKSFTIPIVSDATVEDNETIGVQLQIVVGRAELARRAPPW
jgi:hypothetical protein